MTAASYLAADAAALGDVELAPKAPALRPLTDTVIQELEYAATLFQRADRAVCAELVVLEAAGVALDGEAVSNARFCLSRLQYECRMALMLSRGHL